VLLINDNLEDVEEAKLELTQTEALLIAQYARNILLWRLRNDTDLAKARLGALNGVVSRLVHGGLVDHAWQLLIDAASCIDGFGQFNDEIILRLAELIKFIGKRSSPYAQVSVYPELIQSNWFQNSAYLMVSLRTKRDKIKKKKDSHSPLCIKTRLYLSPHGFYVFRATYLA